jgi:hypothetical protein
MREITTVFVLIFFFAGSYVQSALPQGIGDGRIGFSLSGSGDLNGNGMDREEILLFEEGMGSRILFANEGFAFMIGDVNGDGVEDVPSNVDALHVKATPQESLPSALLFSTSTNGFGVKDGDVVRFQNTGGVEIFMAESDFVTVTGASDGNVDVDAFSLSPAGEVYFSFADNEDSFLLSGSQPGIIEDGDILFIDGQGKASILYTEADVSDLVLNATGSSYKIVDVLSLCHDSVNQCLCFTVQSPSSYDGTVFTDANGGTLVTGYEEPDFGFSNAIELDALSLLPVYQDLRAFQIEPRYPDEGDTITLTLTGGEPSEPFFLLLSGAKTGASLPPYIGGYGVMMLDMDHPFFNAGLSGISNLTGFYNAGGVGQFVTTLPVYPDPVDIHLQAVDPEARVYAHPLTMEMNQ